MKLKDVSFKLQQRIDAIVTNPKYKAEQRKKRLIVDDWNAVIGDKEHYTQDAKLKAIYLAYEGMVTSKIADMLTLDELVEFTNVITTEMENTMFNSWKRRK